MTDNTAPASDIREALGLAIESAINLGPIYGVSFAGRIADSILAAPDIEVSPHGMVTDAEVEAAAGAICRAAEGESLADVRMGMREQYMREARAALEAAGEARNAAH